MDDSKLIYTLATNIEEDIITQEFSGAFSSLTTEMISWVVDTREQALRDALIALGWTPPKKSVNDMHFEELE